MFHQLNNLQCEAEAVGNVWFALAVSENLFLCKVWEIEYYQCCHKLSCRREKFITTENWQPESQVCTNRYIGIQCFVLSIHSVCFEDSH